MKTNPIQNLLPALLGLLLALTWQANAQTITWQENWESPSAQDNWYADFGIWEIGVPTFGPPNRGDGWRAHQGTNCAATFLSGNYLDNRQSRLVSPPVLVPVASLNPRLRFWHWWSFNSFDYGQVQISTNNGVTWTNLSPKYGYDGVTDNYSSSGKWTRSWLDLKAYAGQTVLLGLYFKSAGIETSSGWYVDELEIETGPLPTMVWPEDFEDVGAVDRWQADYGVWEIGQPSGSGPGSAHGGSGKCLATILSGNYTDNRSSRIASPAFVVPDASLNPRLRFWHWWNFNGFDYGQVQISTNNGGNWEALSGRYGEDGAANIYSSDGRWSRGWLDLKAYAGQTVLLGFYFKTAGIEVSTGWYVDDLMIETGPLLGLDLPEGFENGWGGWRAQYSGGWATDFAIWEIGSPTSGPGGAHGGSGKCLATILGGNYTDNRSSRIVSPAFVVPEAGLNPQLRFWHWWSFNSFDYGQVQISTNNGVTWTNLSPQYSGDSGAWTYAPPLGLSAYGGQSVTLGFYFHSAGIETSSGWYVDDIVLLADGHQPMITAQPTNVTVVVGNTASFSVSVWSISTPPLVYQWRFNGSPIPGATDATYTIGSAQTNQQGGYVVIITNIYGAATSVPPAMLTVLEPVVVATDPQSQTVCVGSDVTFTVDAAGTGPLNYQWRSNGIPIAGANAPTLFLPKVQLPHTGSIFSALVSNAASSTNSVDALLTVIPCCDAFVSHDVGDVSTPGGFSQSNCVFTVWGNGEDIEDTADAFHFVHQPLIGDGQIVARVLSIQGADVGAEAGLMMRESLAVGSRHVFVALNAGKNVTFRRRLALNAYSADTRFPATNSAWLRLMRLGNTFVAHSSTNGQDWNYVWFTTLDLPGQLEVGLAVTAHSYGQMATGRFDSVTLGGLTSIQPWTQPGPRIYLGGEGGGMTEFLRLGGFKALAAGSVGERYTVWASPEIAAPFAAWQDIGTVTNVYGVVPFTDAGALTNGMRFYRATVVSP